MFWKGGIITEEAIKIITNLVYVLQKIEREGYDLYSDEIKIVWQAKTFLGYSTPVSIEEGTGCLVREETE